MAVRMTTEDFQRKIDEKYGVGEWKAKTEYFGSDRPIVMVHKCGQEKSLTRASSFTRLNTCKCESSMGRPKLSFEELDERIQRETYGTYRLVELIDSTEFTVEHKSCDRKPFKTTVSRFFSRGQRCQCSKSGVVGRREKRDIGYDC